MYRYDLRSSTGFAPFEIVYGSKVFPVWNDQFREEIQTLAKAGILVPSLSAWSSPIMPVKNEMAWRSCVLILGRSTLFCLRPIQIPLIDDVIDKLGEAPKIYLSKGFYQIPMSKANQCKLAFCTLKGK